LHSIIRVEHDKNNPFVIVSTELIRDKLLSFEARGFLIFLLAKPDEWRIRPEALAKECGLHFTTIYRLIKVLIKSGYISREIITRRTPEGRFTSGSLYTVYEKRIENVPF
jgi:DNA-binding MarR family transcriptional regulator